MFTKTTNMAVFIVNSKIPYIEYEIVSIFASEEMAVQCVKSIIKKWIESFDWPLNESDWNESDWHCTEYDNIPHKFWQWSGYRVRIEKRLMYTDYAQYQAKINEE